MAIGYPAPTPPVVIFMLLMLLIVFMFVTGVIPFMLFMAFMLGPCAFCIFILFIFMPFIVTLEASPGVYSTGERRRDDRKKATEISKGGIPGPPRRGGS